MYKNKKSLYLSIILIIIWMLFIFFMSNMDEKSSNSKSKYIVNNVINKIDSVTNVNDEVVKIHQSTKYIDKINYFFRKFLHAIEYMALAVLVFNLFIRLKTRKLYMYNLLTILVCFLYACTDEFHQTFINGRTGQFLDVLIDTSGAIMGCILINIVYLFVKNHYKKRITNE